ncbi:MAG: HD domain-containing protein [Candidatus Omnitrophica bacterium]|nr:HD domain-containing protein [Candidatus Omnitrophota bacterium]
MKRKREDIHYQISQAYKKLKESYMEAILCFALAAEYKDADTGQHIIRISDYSVVIAQELGLKKDEVELLKYASTMHDIGKIGIPDYILQKNSSLSDAERKIMHDHTNFGARIFKHSSSPILKAASEIALAHHERYDGKGYPRGLKAQEIPLFGRIVCLADSFDAMVSKRCYKSEMKFEDAVKEIKKEAGKQFDPGLVHIFLKCQDKIKQILSANITIGRFANRNNGTG